MKAMLGKNIFNKVVIIIMVLYANHNIHANSIPKITAKYAVIYDLASKQFIYEKNAERKVPPASTVKLLTAMVVLDKWKTDKKITVPKSSNKIPPYKLYLVPNEKYSVLDLLNAMLLRSANDAAHTLAVRSYGSEKKFAKAMNHKAKKLGAFNSNFINPHGLPNDKQIVTAKDMALIVEHVKNYPVIENILKSKIKFFPGPLNKQTKLINRNKLLQQDFNPMVIGKTGFTNKAGRCFAGYTKNNKMPFVVIVLNANYRWEDVKKLLIWGNGFYKRQIDKNKIIYKKNKIVEFQKFFIDIGLLDGKADGIFGFKTLAALLKFQGIHNIQTNGIIENATLSKIMEINPDISNRQ